MNIEQTLFYYGERVREYESIIEKEGSLRRSDWWKLEYYRNPYLLLSDFEEFRQRYIDIFTNVCGLNESGQIVPIGSFGDNKYNFMKLFAHIIEEANSRGGLQFDMMEEGRREIFKYFENGEPPGVDMFRGLPRRTPNTLVKFSKRKYLEPMLERGEIRMSPASYYAQGSLLKSMRDLETSREFRIPALKEALEGQGHVVYNDQRLPIYGGAVTVKMEVSDYYLFCSCLDHDRRMPTDFDSDSALIINDAREFVRKVRKAFKKQVGQAEFFAGPVEYYDPFLFDISGRFNLEMIKHFAYSYQKEHRIALRPVVSDDIREPIHIEIGSIEKIAEIVPRL